MFYLQLCKAAALSYSKGSPVLSTGGWKELPQLKKSTMKSKGKIHLNFKGPALGLLYSNSTSSSNSQVREMYFYKQNIAVFTNPS